MSPFGAQIVKGCTMTSRAAHSAITRSGVWAFSLGTALFAGGSALAEGPEVVAVYEGAWPKAGSGFAVKGKGYDRPAGVLRFAVPPTEASTAGLDREFASFCAEPLASVVGGRTYRFEARRPDDPEAFGLPDTADGRAEAERRAGYVRELFGRHYPAAVRGSDPVPAAAFQVALWELTQEGDPPAAGQPFSLTSGAFRSRDGGAEEAAVAARAEEMLRSLTGSDAVFYEAEGTRGAELVRLRGVANLAGEVAQSQFTLRNTALASGGGGAPGAGGGGSPNLLGGGGGGGSAPGLAAGGRGGSGPSGGGGGGGLFGGGNGSNTPPVATTNGSTNTTTPAANNATTGSTFGTTVTTSTTVTNSNGGNANQTTTTTATTTTTNTDTVNNPTTTNPTTTNGTPGNGENETSTNTVPVPGPPAVVLGLVAMGFFAGRRAFTRAGRR
jgi:hypothetical protein